MAMEQIRVEDMVGLEASTLLCFSSGIRGFRQIKLLTTLPSGPVRFLVLSRDDHNRDQEQTFDDMAEAVRAYNEA